MILAFDSYYFESKAKTVCFQFENWTDSQPTKIYKEITEQTQEYESGAFYKRELPCIVSLLKQIDLTEVSVIIVDSFVILDDSGKIGLGGHLYEYLERKIPIIGVAKTNFAQNTSNKREIIRGQSKKPLYVTALGIDLEEATQKVSTMVGEYRMPTLLKLLDTMTKEE